MLRPMKGPSRAAALAFLLTVNMAAARPVSLTMAEVARHDRPDDCWMVVDGQVYDATPFVPAHPGGEKILRGCGKDASWFVAHRDGAAQGHSEAMRARLRTLRLGALGEEVEVEGAPVPALHPHDARLRGRRLALLPTAEVAPHLGIDLEVQHHLPTDGAVASRVSFALGVGLFDWLDVHAYDVRGDERSGLDAKARLLDQRSGRPLSVALGVGVGMFTGDDDGIPHAAFAQLPLGRSLLRDRLSLRVVPTAAYGFDGTWEAAVGGALEFRPIPLHGVFAEVSQPLRHGALTWSGGLSFYTWSHAFSVYASRSAALHPVALAASPDDPGVTIGFALQRVFQL